MKKIPNGFTLIELLVVIAVIGLLSSIILATLTSARKKGKDGSIKSQLISLRSQSELFYANNSNTYGSASTYAAACAATPVANTVFAHTNVNAIILATAKLAGGTNQTKGFCVSLGSSFTAGAAIAGASWAVAMPLVSDPTKAFCVDSKGQAKEETLSPTPDVGDVFAATSIGTPSTAALCR